MRFVFWQNILSIHQSAFLRHLADSFYTTLVVEQDIAEERKTQGWGLPDFGKVQVVIAPTKKEIQELLTGKESIHIFSGINSFPLVTRAFQNAIKQKLNIGVILEPFDWIGWKGKLRYIKYFLLQLRYGHAIDFLLTIGNRGRICYEKTGFSRKKIYDWAYFTEEPNITIPESDRHRLPQIIFVGRLDENKNVLSLISACKEIKENISKLQIIGDGPLKQTVLQAINNNPLFEYLGILSNQEVQLKINEADLLVLPSIYKDGWGAVVNEALMCGVPVIASDHCGASILLDNSQKGYVFSAKKDNLKEILLNAVNRLPYSLKQKEKLRTWALKSISGRVAVNYYKEIIKRVYGKTDKVPVAPWMKEEDDE